MELARWFVVYYELLYPETMGLSPVTYFLFVFFLILLYILMNVLSHPL